jgi:hypothetical protein
MQNIMLSCGCCANSTCNGKPSCTTHFDIPGGVFPVEPPNLEGRKARCAQCGNTSKSSLELPFFEFRGIGSHQGNETCKNCHYYKIAHKPGAHSGICGNFESVGSFEFDNFYCGCRGWE